jgi:hypothetical protein
MPVGSTKYVPEFDKVARNLCLTGATDEDLAKTFGIAIGNLYKWKVRHVTFREAIYQGKDAWDGDRVENALLKRALGYDYKEFIDENVGTDDDGNVTGEMITTKKTTKHLPPDASAAKWWLANRRGKRWRDVSRILLAGGDEGPIKHEVGIKDINKYLKKRGIPLPEVDLKDLE